MSAMTSAAVTFSPLETSSILNRCDSPQMPFVWTVNPYRGCEFACTYCYARYTHEFLGDDARSFETDIYVKQHVAAALRRDLARRVEPGEAIAIGTATDPYQPAERRYGTTRALLEVFAQQRGHVLSVTTKSSLIRRDRELLADVGRHNDLVVNFSLTSLDAMLARRLEPRAPTPARRLQTMRLLRDAGIEIGLFLMPILPGITDDRATLDGVISAAGGAGAGFVASNVLFLRQPTREIFFDHVRQHHADQLPAYQRAYAGSGYLSAAYRNELGARVRAMARRHGLASGRPQAVQRCRPAQLALAL
jgi:DNA repair photolyase